MDIEKPNFKKICHMYLRGLQNFPYIEKDFDAITDYQILCKVVDYLNQVIDNTNVQNTNITNLYNAFIELKNYVDKYFDENFPQLVNDKINELVEDGTLENILHSRLNIITIYNTFQDVLTSTNLVKDLTIETLGYYNINDGGGAKYKITDEMSETEYQEEISNDLYATLICNIITPEQLGAYGDGTHDDTLAIQNTINYAISKKILLKSDNTKKYKITDTLIIDGIIKADFGRCEINANFDDNIIDMKITDISEYIQNNEAYWVHGGYLKNLIINGNNQGTGILFNGQKKFIIENIEIVNCNVGLNVKSSTECVFNTIRFQKCLTGLLNEGADALFENIFGRFCQVGMDLRSYTQIINSHFWVRDSEFQDSIYAKIYGGANLVNVQIDSYQTGIKLLNTGGYTLEISGMYQQQNDNKEYTLFDVTEGTYNATGGSIRLHDFSAICKSELPLVKFSNVNSDVFSGYIDYESCRFLNIDKFPYTTHSKLVDITSKLDVIENRIDITPHVINIRFRAKVLESFLTETIAKLPLGPDSSDNFIPLNGFGFIANSSNEYNVNNSESIICGFVAKNRNVILAIQGSTPIAVNKYIDFNISYIRPNNYNLNEN